MEWQFNTDAQWATVEALRAIAEQLEEMNHNADARQNYELWRANES